MNGRQAVRRAPSPSRTLDQLRAESALARVNKLTGLPDKFRNHYRSYTDRIGPTIVMNGLGQALATEQAAAGPRPEHEKTWPERAHQKLHEGLQEWLCRKDHGVYPGAPDLLAAIVKGNQSDYVRAQAEALAWLEWHKKFCRARFAAPQLNDGGDE